MTAPATARQEQIAREESVLTSALAGWPEKYADVEVRRYVACGEPAAVMEAQSHAAQLLVIGRGGDADNDARLGTVARAVLHSHACPVLVVPRSTEP